MVDSDARLPNGNVVERLQWLQPNLRGTPRELLADSTAQNYTDNPGASYYRPKPAPGTGRHDYTLVLYRQPADWTVPSNYASFCAPMNFDARVPFNISDFAQASGLRDPVASNYFWERNDGSS